MSHQFINSQFSDYLNRYCTGIVKLKEELNKVSISFFLSESFAYHSCQFHIDIDFYDYKGLSDINKEIVNECFKNSSNSSGSKFISFIYKPQRDLYIDHEVIRSFIYHYEFAQSLFEGFIKNILPDKCELKIESLDSDPFFNYINSFFDKEKYSDENQRSFEHKYFAMMKRSFKFDRQNHKKLVGSALKDLQNYKHSITDTRIYDIGAGVPEDIRNFVIDQNVAFSYLHNPDVINEIHIDSIALKERLLEYTPVESYKSINAKKIIQIIDTKLKELADNEKADQQMIESLGIKPDDYIFINNGTVEMPIGKVESIKIRYNTIEISYRPLKEDLSDTSRYYKSITAKDYSHYISAKLFCEEVDENFNKGINHVARFFKNKGIKNPFFKAPKKG